MEASSMCQSGAFFRLTLWRSSGARKPAVIMCQSGAFFKLTLWRSSGARKPVLVRDVFQSLPYGGVVVRGSHQGVCASEGRFLKLTLWRSSGARNPAGSTYGPVRGVC